MRALHGTGDGRPPFVGVDDAHLLDEASAALVALLVRSGSAAVVVTLRSGESAPDAIVALWKDNSAPLIALQTLARVEVDTLVTSVLDGTVEGSTLHALWESSGGNALYLRELVCTGSNPGHCSIGTDCGAGPVRSSPAIASRT